MCLSAASETKDAIDGSSAVMSTTIVVTDPAIDSRGRMCFVLPVTHSRSTEGCML